MLLSRNGSVMAAYVDNYFVYFNFTFLDNEEYVM